MRSFNLFLRCLGLIGLWLLFAGVDARAQTAAVSSKDGEVEELRQTVRDLARRVLRLSGDDVEFAEVERALHGAPIQIAVGKTRAPMRSCASAMPMAAKPRRAATARAASPTC